MTGPRFENSLSWNAASAILAAVLAGGISYGVTQGQVTSLKEQVDQERTTRREEYSRLQAQLTTARADQSADRIALARMQEQIGAIAATVNRIDMRLEGVLDERREKP